MRANAQMKIKEHMEKTILINETAKETRIAILENGELVEFYVEKPGKNRMVGSIYKGKVENVIEGIQAAFVDIGYQINAFLPFSEIEGADALLGIEGSLSRDETEDAEEDDIEIKGRPPVFIAGSEINLQTGQDILVQVIKEPFAKKGPRVTTNISLPGRFLVLVPNADFIGISRKLRNYTEKRRLRHIVKTIKPAHFGLIVRTVSEGQGEEALSSDLENLLDKWSEVEKKIRTEPAPVCVYQDLELASSVIRDLLTPDVDKIIVDTKNMYRDILGYLKEVSPAYIKRLEYYSGRKPLFDQYEVEKEFEKSLHKKVWLKSGGFIVIEHTEAMTTIDVNSGKFIGKKGHEENALKINLQAAKEIARQLRLRDVGGLIVIDFIDMERDENKKRVVQEFKHELKKDRAKVAVAQISAFGLLEMTRQRTRLTLLDSVSEECPTCHGSGRITSKESLLTKLESWFKRFKAESKERRLILQVHPNFAEYLHQSTARILWKMQLRHLVRIKLEENPLLKVDEFRVISARSGEDLTEK